MKSQYICPVDGSFSWALTIVRFLRKRRKERRRIRVMGKLGNPI